MACQAKFPSHRFVAKGKLLPRKEFEVQAALGGGVQFRIHEGAMQAAELQIQPSWVSWTRIGPPTAVPVPLAMATFNAPRQRYPAV